MSDGLGTSNSSALICILSEEAEALLSFLEYPDKCALQPCLPANFLHLLLVRNVYICYKVHLVQLHRFRSLNQLPTQIHDQHDRQLDVKADEANTVECRAETTPTLDKYQHTVEDNAEVRANRICPVAKGEQMGFALTFEG